MSGLIDHIQERRTTSDATARVLGMADEDADEVLDALASDSGRSTLRMLFEEPSTPSEIAAELDTSVQNVHYHLSNLQDARLVEPVDTVYSEKGNEMTVYGPASDPLVFVGDDRRTAGVRQSLSGVVGGLALLGLASLFVQWGAERLFGPGGSGPTGVGPASWSTDPSTPTETIGWAVFHVVEPGVLFFVLALVVAAVAMAVVERR